MRCLLVVSVAILLAAAGLIRVDSPAEAAGGDYASGCGGDEVFLYATERLMLTLHNDARKTYGLKPLCVDPILQKAARAHSKDMIQHHYYSHYSKENNEAPCTRIRRFGYTCPPAERTSDTMPPRMTCSAPGCGVPSTSVTYWMGGSAKSA